MNHIQQTKFSETVVTSFVSFCKRSNIPAQVVQESQRGNDHVYEFTIRFEPDERAVCLPPISFLVQFENQESYDAHKNRLGEYYNTLKNFTGTLVKKTWEK